VITLKVKQKRVGPVIGCHPWVFSKAFLSIPDGIQAGEPIQLRSEDGTFLAYGYFGSYSQIAVRLWGFDESEKINEEFFIHRIEKAYSLRKRFVEKPGTNAYRVINGESDFLPGLIVDKYADYLIVQFHTHGIERWKKEIVEGLEKVIEPQGIYERSDASVRKIEMLEQKSRLIAGHVPDLVTIEENGFKFLVDVQHGQKTGFFLDQRDKRHAFMKYAEDRSVLNCFSYTGGFSVYALAGGASSVVNIDTSASALELARENIKLNSFDAMKCTFICDDVKKYLRCTTETFDAIILDPPAFIKDRRKKHEGITGYKSINERALKALSRKGLLLTCSCSAHLTLEDFRYLISEVGGKLRKPLSILETYTHGIDHPRLLPFTEGDYLKCFILAVNN
jgi:23S rRNA (cytosine1962-C5)-methyltransferase